MKKWVIGTEKHTDESYQFNGIIISMPCFWGIDGWVELHRASVYSDKQMQEAKSLPVSGVWVPLPDTQED